MAQRVGIDDYTEQRIISGARVASDPRTTAEADAIRSPKNRKADEKPLRTAEWRIRQIANWHADKACEAYHEHIGCVRKGNEDAAEACLSRYARHILIADHLRKAAGF